MIKQVNCKLQCFLGHGLLTYSPIVDQLMRTRIQCSFEIRWSILYLVLHLYFIFSIAALDDWNRFGWKKAYHEPQHELTLLINFTRTNQKINSIFLCASSLLFVLKLFDGFAFCSVVFLNIRSYHRGFVLDKSRLPIYYKSNTTPHYKYYALY